MGPHELLKGRNVVPEAFAGCVTDNGQVRIRVTGDDVGHRAQKPEQVLVRVHAADIDEQLRQRRYSVGSPSRGGNGRIVHDAKHRVGGLRDDVDAVPGDAENPLDIGRRGLRHRHRARRLQLGECGLELPEAVIEPGRKQILRQSLGRRVVVAHDTRNPGQQRKVRVDGGEEKDIAAHAAGELRHLPEVAEGARRRANGRLRQLRPVLALTTSTPRGMGIANRLVEEQCVAKAGGSRRPAP
jgi:hypothetical protein